MVKKIVDDTLYTLELAQVQQLLERSIEISDATALQNLRDDPDLRHNTQAILDTMYRRPHGRKRIMNDSIAITKLLLGFAHDVGTQIIKGAEEQIYRGNSGNNNSDNTDEPPVQGELVFVEQTEVAEGVEAAATSQEADANVLSRPQGGRQ
jgi:hypothetical protein